MVQKSVPIHSWMGWGTKVGVLDSTAPPPPHPPSPSPSPSHLLFFYVDVFLLQHLKMFLNVLWSTIHDTTQTIHMPPSAKMPCVTWCALPLPLANGCVCSIQCHNAKPERGAVEIPLRFMRMERLCPASWPQVSSSTMHKAYRFFFLLL